MSIRNGVWMNAEQTKPEPGVRVLCVKLPKSGIKDYCFGTWYAPNEYYPEGHWVTNGSCSNVILWMPLPRIP